MQQFWMVHGIGQGAPTRRHATDADARREAERLARKHLGTSFVVMEARTEFLAGVAPVEARTLEIARADDSCTDRDESIPF